MLPLQIRAFILWVALASGVVDATSGQPGTLDTGFGMGGKASTHVGVGTNSVANAMALQTDGKLVLVGYCPGALLNAFCALRYNPDGTLDPTFGAGGSVRTSVSAVSSQANAIALQADGKIVLAGQCAGGNNDDFCALRYNMDGSLDASFGIGGTVTTAISTGDDIARAVAVQPNGKILLVGGCTHQLAYSAFCALRLNADGSLDTSFGSGGKVIRATGSADAVARSIAIQSDGKILLAGSCWQGSFELFCTHRYNESGSYDMSFAVFGFASTRIGTGTNSVANAITLQPDNKIVLVGYCSGAMLFAFCALRYDQFGALDMSFGAGGSIRTSVSAISSVANAVTMQPDGKIVLAGNCAGANNDDFCALRYHGNGTLDTTFGNGGTVVTPVGSAINTPNVLDVARAIVLQPDGKIVIAGSCWNDSNEDFCTIRYDGGPFGFQNCKMDVDGNGSVLATTDVLIHARVALGMTGSAVTNGITFPSSATRTTWSAIRTYLWQQCGMSLPQ